LAEGEADDLGDRLLQVVHHQVVDPAWYGTFLDAEVYALQAVEMMLVRRTKVYLSLESSRA